jgi:hypothetical protein
VVLFLACLGDQRRQDLNMTPRPIGGRALPAQHFTGPFGFTQPGQEMLTGLGHPSRIHLWYGAAKISAAPVVARPYASGFNEQLEPEQSHGWFWRVGGMFHLGPQVFDEQASILQASRCADFVTSVCSKVY